MFSSIMGCQVGSDTGNGAPVANDNPSPISPDPVLPKVAISLSATSIIESSPEPLVITVSRTENLEASMIVTIDVNNSLSLSEDFVAGLVPLEFASGEVSKTINLVPLQNTNFEPVRTYQFSLASSSEYQIDSSSASVELKSTDDDLYTIAFSLGSGFSVAEDSGLTKQIIIQSISDAFQPVPVAFDVPVKLELGTTGNLTHNADFTGPLSATIPAGSSSVVLEYTVIDDTLLEGDESTVLSISADDSYALAFFSTFAGMMVLENEGPIVGVQMVSGSSSKEAGPVSLVVKVSRMNGDMSAPLTVLFETIGTATPVIDYTMTSYNQIVIPANISSVDLTLTVVNDSLVEVSESFGLRIKSDPNYVISASKIEYQSYIQDNDSTPETRSVELSATPQLDPLAINISWINDSPGVSYVIYKKAYGESSWGTAIANLPPGTASYLDSNIIEGQTYEYKVDRSSTGLGYIYAGVNIPPAHSRGKILLIKESTMAASLSSEIERLEMDLVGDGWQVVSLQVLATDSVASVKNLILNEYNSDPANVKMIYLLGKVPVPYSGDIFPDGHTDHRGAWPADVFYGEINGTWTDSTVNYTNPTRTAQTNIPGDGKYDQSFLSSSVDLAVGRVDLSNLPQFAPLTEVDLLRRYLNKNHNYRHRTFNVPNNAIIEDNWSTHAESFGTSGWRNFGALVGRSQILAADWLATIKTQSFLWGWGGGGGNFTSASGIATTADYAANSTFSVFNMLFGSYFGDWNTQNSLLRAPLAGDGYGLTNAWSGRPFWYFHHMSAGDPIGYSAKVSQNNLSTYSANGYGTYIHIALMGDPSLRQHIVTPASSLNCALNGSNVDLNWIDSPDSVLGYHIYKSQNRLGPFTQITSSPIVGSAYTDTSSQAGHWYYMVRPMELTVSNSASFYNLGQGVFTEIDVP